MRLWVNRHDLCANATAAIPYVKVWVDTVDCEGNPVVISTYSDAGGNYRLDNVLAAPRPS